MKESETLVGHRRRLHFRLEEAEAAERCSLEVTRVGKEA